MASAVKGNSKASRRSSTGRRRPGHLPTRPAAPAYDGLTAAELGRLMMYADNFNLHDITPGGRDVIGAVFLAAAGGPMPPAPLDVYREFMAIWRGSGQFDYGTEEEFDDLAEIVSAIVRKFLARAERPRNS